MNKINKLGLGIIAFEGTEHLKNITYELRDCCDVISVCLQKISYHGKPIHQEDIDEVEHLKKIGLVDNIIWFEPQNLYEDNAQDKPRLIETDKRNFILDHLEFEQVCTHSIVIDSDEFYDRTDFQNAKNFIDTNKDIHVTYCQYVNYYRDYQHILIWPYHCYVPFISESNYRFKFRSDNFTKPSDPTRRYFMNHGNKVYHILNYKMIKMHHLSWIRKDISRKIDNWSSKQLFENSDDIKSAILERYTNFREGDNAIIMFNVPFYELVVYKLPRQFIHPEYSLWESAEL